MHSTAFDESAHDNDESDSHKHYQIPVAGDPLGHCEQSFPIEKEILKTHQRTISIDGTTLEKDIAIALEVVTW